MKLGKLTLGIITAATLIVVNCAAAGKTVSEESLGLELRLFIRKIKQLEIKLNMVIKLLERVQK